MRATVVVGIVCVIALAAADRAARSASLAADGRFDHAFFRGFNDYDQDRRARTGFRHSRIVLSGLRAGAVVEGRLEARARRGALPLRLYAADRQVAAAELTETAQAVSFRARSDSRGMLELRFRGGAVRVARVDLTTGDEAGALPARRAVLYAGLVALAGGLGAWLAGGRVGAVTTALAATLAFGWWLQASRLHALHALPQLLIAGAALPPLALAIGRWPGLPPPAARFVSAALILKLAAVAQPAFPSIDGAFHAHNLAAFRQGELITSRAPGATPAEKVRVPYPPALYALLTPPAALLAERPPGAGRVQGESLVRVAQALLEGTAPLLLFLIARAGGLSPLAGGHAAAAAALMPESLLVLAKGIAANTLGVWLTLLFALAAVSGAGALRLGGATLLVLLSHLGAALTLAALLAFWAGRALLTGTVPRKVVWTTLSAAGGAAALAWIAYYGEAAASTAASLGAFGGGLLDAPADFLSPRWYRVGKTLQDLLLKFGAAPLALAAIGLASAPAPLAAWLRPWLGAGLGLFAVAVLTPVPLRFEYFLIAGVALAAGAGAARLADRGRHRWVSAAWWWLLAFQLGLAMALLFDRFYLISVIMESPRWPFPLH